MTKFANKSFSTPANSQKYRDNWDSVFTKDPPRCEVTKNPCGSDTKPAGVTCSCKTCQVTLSTPQT